MREEDERAKFDAALRNAVREEVTRTEIKIKQETGIQIAINAIKKGADDAFITDITGLTISQIQALRADLQK